MMAVIMITPMMILMMMIMMKLISHYLSLHQPMFQFLYLRSLYLLFLLELREVSVSHYLLSLCLQCHHNLRKLHFHCHYHLQDLSDLSPHYHLNLRDYRSRQYLLNLRGVLSLPTTSFMIRLIHQFLNLYLILILK